MFNRNEQNDNFLDAHRYSLTKHNGPDQSKKPAGGWWGQKKATAQPLYQANMSHTHVFRELVPTQASQREGKRSIELHLDDVMSKCSLRDLYYLRQVYQRNMFCSVTGVLLEIRDPDIAGNYLISNQLQPSMEPTSINEPTKEPLSDEGDDSTCTFLLRFSQFSPPKELVSFYQRALPRENRVTHCSVSEEYVVYSVIVDPNQGKVIPEFQTHTAEDDAKNTLIVVIDIAKKSEIVLRNPSQGQITAVYVDACILMLGSNSSLYHVKSSQLFSQGAADKGQESLFEYTSLNNNQLGSLQTTSADGEDEIYAFWHTKNQPKVDVYVKSKCRTLLSLYTFHTNDGLEKLRLAHKRRQLRRQTTASGFGTMPAEEEEDIAQIKLQKTLDLNEDFKQNRLLKKLDTLTEPSFKHSKTNYGESDSQASAAEDSDESNSLLQELSDAEGYVSEHVDEDNPAEAHDKVDHLEFKLKDMHKMGSVQMNGTLAHSHMSEPDSPQLKKKASHALAPTKEQLEMPSQVSMNYSTKELREPFLPKKKVNNDDQARTQAQASDQLNYSPDQVQITRVKFHRRNTIVFRSDGHIDFVGSSNVVYSSRNIDFKKMKWEPISESTDLKERQRHSPTITDVMIDDHDLLLVTSERKIYLFSLEKMTVSLMQISIEQARLFSYHNRLQIFSDYLVFDNFVLVTHQNMVSIFDLNAKVCRIKSWRHISQPSSDIIAEDRDTFNNQESRRDPFRVCNLNIRLIKMRQSGEVQPRVLVVFRNNVIRMLTRDKNIKWQYDQFSTKLIHGEITELICSRKADSLVLLRHKEKHDSETSQLTVFYYNDSTEDLNRWKVIDGLQDHQRIIQISLQGRFMQNLNEQASQPKIAIYDDKLHNLVVYRLEPPEESSIEDKNAPSNAQSYGAFREILTIKDFRMLPSDIVTESGNDSFFYLSRQNKIFRCFVDQQALRKVKIERYEQGLVAQDEDLVLSDEHPNMELMATIASRYQKYTATIEDFRIIEDNQTTYVYASTRSNIYFNQISQFGKLFSGSKLFSPQLARQSLDLYVDDFYGQFSFFSGPFEISVLPLLSNNRISLRGAHQEPVPIFYQTRGYESCHMLTREGEIKTWDTNTGKLIGSVQLDKAHYYGFQRLNSFRNRTLLVRQNQKTLHYEYLCVEIISKSKIKEHARVVSPDYMNFYINCNDNLLLTEHRGQKHNVFEVTKFDKKSGSIQSVTRTFNRNIPMNFLSPSFYHYIDVDSQTRRIRVMDTMTDQLVCQLPQHLYKFMISKKEQFTVDMFVNKLIFVDDDFILMELNGYNEIIFHVPSRRTVSSFNNLCAKLRFNEKFMPIQFSVEICGGTGGSQEATPHGSLVDLASQVMIADERGIKRQTTAWVSPKQHAQIALQQKLAQHEYTNPVQNAKCASRRHLKSDSNQYSQILDDFMYQNMKRQRHIHFFDQHAVCTVIREKGRHQDERTMKQMQLYTVRPFSYAVWKLMEDICTDKIVKVENLSKNQLATICFAILPDSQGARIRRALSKVKGADQVKEIEEQLKQHIQQVSSTPTLLHKLTVKNPEQIKPLIERMRKDWPKLFIPHINNNQGQSPIQVAQQYRHRRVLGWLLDMLSKYPFGYCQYSVTEMLIANISEGFESKVGQYLDSRFMPQEWTEFYQTGRLLVSENGINQTSVNNWPSRTQNLEQKFFKQECDPVPVYLRLCDCSNLHSFSGDHLQKLLIALTRCDISIFSHKSIQVLLEYTWEQTRCAIIGWLFIPFVMYVITYMIFLEILFSADTGSESDHNHLRAYTMVTQGLLLIFAIYFIQLHTRQIILQGCHLNTALVWSSVDLVPLLVNLVSICIQLSNNYEGSYLLEIQKPIYACATLFLFLKLFYFLRYFREIGHLVRMIFTVMYLMRFFFVVFACFVLTFACAFYAFTGGQDLADKILFVFFITIRKSNTDFFEDGYELLLWILFISTSMFFTYIMLNITVSMVKGFYDAQMRIKTESMFNVMTQLTLDCYPFIRTSQSERALLPPEGTEEFVEEANYIDVDKSRFEFRLRESSFCNQYLLLAETEKEMGKTLLQAEKKEPIRELERQVNQGFSRVSMQLQHQDEIILGQKGVTGRDKRAAEVNSDFDSKVQEVVDKRMSELTEKHSREIAELKEGQQEMLRLLRSSLEKKDE